MTKLQTGMIGAVVAAGLAASFLIFWNARTANRETDGWLRQQTEQLASLQGEGARLSNLLALETSPGPNTLDALQQLRAEAARLRQQTNDLKALREESYELHNALQTARQDTQETNVESTARSEEWSAKQKYVSQLAQALWDFASKHEDRFPASFDEAATFVTARTGKPTGDATARFEIVYHGSKASIARYAYPMLILLIRERQPWKNSDGKWAKAYAFVVGNTDILSLSDGNFETWEQQHILPPQPSNP